MYCTFELAHVALSKCLFCSTGIRNRIQISQSTANLLNGSGKAHWVKPREDAVKAKVRRVMLQFPNGSYRNPVLTLLIIMFDAARAKESLRLSG